MLGICLSEASAQVRPPLQLTLRQVGLRSRAGSPIPVDVNFQWAGPGILEGRLEVTFMDGREVIARYQSTDLAATSGEQTMRMLFPPLNRPYLSGQVEAEVRFRTKDRVYDFAGLPIAVAATRQAGLTLCVSDPSGGRDAETNQLVKTLRLDRYVTEQDRDYGTGVSCLPVHVLPDDIPTIPMAYCCYDVVVLTGQGFSRLKERQLKAVLAWVEAGGSVCVVPERDLKSYHVEFLNALLVPSGPVPSGVEGLEGKSNPAVAAKAALAESARFALDASGVAGASGMLPRDGVFRLHVGLGCAVIATAKPDLTDDVGAYAWRRAACFLWKTTHEAQTRILGRGAFRLESTNTWEANRFRSTGALIRALLPKGARLIPVPVIILVLVLFVIAVGPGDYFLLGLIRRRMLTWVVFPVLSVLFALFMVYLSEQYLGRADHRGTIWFVDVGRDGRVLRTNRYELIFAARSVDAVTELQGCWFTPVDVQQLDMEMMYGYGRYYEHGDGGKAPFYAGRLPTQYRVEQGIRKWTPQVNRIFSLDPPKLSRPVGKLNWAALDAKRPESQQELRQMKERLVGDGPFEGNIYILHLGNLNTAHKKLSFEDTAATDRYTYGDRRQTVEDFIREVTARTVGSGSGFFSAVRQVSPTAGAGFDDLAVADATDPDQWVVIVTVLVHDDIVVYRRTLYGEN